MADEETQAQEPKKKSKLKWIILGVLILALAGGGYFAYDMFFASKDGGTEEGAGGDAQQKEGDAPKEGMEQVVTLPTFLVNLADPLGRRYLKLTLDVQVVDEASALELENATPKVRDKLILLLSSKTYADLASLESKLLLKTEIVNNLNQVLGGPKVQDVYFTDMVIQ